MSCERLEQLSGYLDGELSTEEAADYARHLERCGVCSRAERDLLDLRSELRDLGVEVDPFVQRGALHRILDSGKPRRLWSRRLSVPVPLAAGVLLALLATSALALSAWGTAAIPSAPVKSAPASPPAGGLDLSRFEQGKRAALIKIPNPERRTGREIR